MSGDPLKVLYCSFDVVPEPTGTSARATELLRSLTAFNVDALTAKSPDHPHIERFHGARLMRVPVGSGDLLVRAQAFERAVRRQLESDEYHLVHFTDPYGGYAVCELKEEHSFKLVYEVVGFPSIEVKYTHPHLESDRRFMAKLRRQELFCLMNADAVLVGCEVTAKLVQGLGVARERISVFPTPVDLEQYAGAGIPRPDRVPMRVIFAGSQISWQGLATLLSAVSIASRSCELRLAIMGPQHPSWRLQLEEMIKYRKLSEIVDLTEPVAPEDMVKALATADVGVAPFERSERTTMQGAPVSKIAHYLAAGRPVVASDLPMVRELLDESCALFHAPGDDEGLARSLIALAHDPARRNALGAAAAKRAHSRLCSKAARVNLLKLYAGLLGELGEQIVISESVAPEVSSDAPTSIGSFKPDDATVTHFEMSSGDGMTDPFGRPEGPKAATTEALTAPQVALPAPNLFVSESFLRGEDGSPDAPVGKEASAPAPDSAPPGGEAVAGADPLEADLAGVEIETWPSKLPAAPPADPYEADLAGLVAEPSDAHAAEKPIAAVVASEHAAPAQLQASPSDEQADEPLIEGTLLPDSDDDEAAAGPAVDEPVLLATALPVEGAAELPLTPGADEQVQHQAAAQPFRQKPPADRALGALPETDASSKSAQSPAPTVDPGVRGDGQLGLSDAKEHFFGEEEAPRAPESPGATAPSEPEPDAGGLVDPWDVEQGSPGGNAGRSAQQAAVPAWRSDSVEPLETWTWDDGPVEPLEVLQGSAGDNGGPAAAAPVAPSLTPGAGAGGSVTYSDAHLESLGAGPIAPPENPLQVPGAQGAFGALSEASELEGAATREEPWDVERTPSAEAGAWKSPKSSASLWATPPPVPEGSEIQIEKWPAAAGLTQDSSAGPATRAPAPAPSAPLPWDKVLGSAPAVESPAGTDAETALPEASPDDVSEVDEPVSPPAPAPLSAHGGAMSAGATAPSAHGAALGTGGPAPVSALPWDSPGSPPHRPVVTGDGQLPPIVRMPGAASPRGALPPVIGGKPPVLGSKPPVLGPGGAHPPHSPAVDCRVPTPPGVAGHPEHGTGGGGAGAGPVQRPGAQDSVFGRTASVITPGGAEVGDAWRPAGAQPQPTLSPVALQTPRGFEAPGPRSHAQPPPATYPLAAGAQAQPPVTAVSPVLGASGQAPRAALSPVPGAQVPPNGAGCQPAFVAHPPGPGKAPPPAGAGLALPSHPPIPEVPSVAAPQEVHSGPPRGAAPVLPQAGPQAPSPLSSFASVDSATAPTSPVSVASGVPPSDEWLGHIVFGYAPFRVSLARRALTGEFQIKPLQRA